MSALVNSHEALLRNQHLLTGRLALLGISDPALLARLPTGGAAMTEHFGVYQQLEACTGWACAYGYSDPVLARGSRDTVVIFLPKARNELTMRLALARSLLVAGGHLILVGEKREGIAGAVKQFRIQVPDAEKADSARHCQVWVGKPGDVSGKFAIADWFSWHQAAVAGTGIEVAGLPGIFSDGRLDEGTGMLLDSFDRAPRGPVLDFACGAGVMGAWLGARWGHDLEVDGVDVQAQAVACARETYDKSGARGRILASDGLSAVDQTYQTIITNPPFHTGVKTDTSMTSRFLQQVREHLRPGGELRLVANSFLPYAGLIREQFGSCHILQENRRFTVYSAIRH